MLQIENLHDNENSTSNWLDEMTVQPDTLVITKITSGIRDPNRVNVFINGRFALSLDIKQIVDLHIKVGRRLSEEELQELHQASEFGKLYQRALEWALTRPHSYQETQQYLKRRQIKRLQNNRQRTQQELKPLPEIQDNAINLVLERLSKRGYIDDQKFARYYVENRFVKKGISQKRLRLELHKKGVDSKVIESVLTDSQRDDKNELAKMVAKKRNRYSEEKLIRYLIRQGFHYQDVVDAVEQAKNDDEL